MAKQSMNAMPAHEYSENAMPVRNRVVTAREPVYNNIPVRSVQRQEEPRVQKNSNQGQVTAREPVYNDIPVSVRRNSNQGQAVQRQEQGMQPYNPNKIYSLGDKVSYRNLIWIVRDATGAPGYPPPDTGDINNTWKRVTDGGRRKTKRRGKKGPGKKSRR
jgi:hypothetical protein